MAISGTEFETIAIFLYYWQDYNLAVWKISAVSTDSLKVLKNCDFWLFFFSHVCLVLLSELALL